MRADRTDDHHDRKDAMTNHVAVLRNNDGDIVFAVDVTEADPTIVEAVTNAAHTLDLDWADTLIVSAPADLFLAAIYATEKTP